MSDRNDTLSVLEACFMGGARISHTNVVVGLHDMGMPQSAVVIHDEVTRECTTQRMYDDPSYARMIHVGMQVSSLGRRWVDEPDHSLLKDVEADHTHHAARNARVIFSLKEQPLHIVNQIDAATPVIVGLHRSDAENHSAGVAEMKKSIDLERLALCIACARSTKESYVKAGIPESLIQVISNGVDTQRFRPSKVDRERIRSELQIDSEAPVVIFAARYDGMKNVPLFLQSAYAYLQSRSDAQVIACGTGIEANNPHLQRDINGAFGEASPDIISRLHLLGRRIDMPALFAASDVCSLTSSHGEAQSLSLLEAMASETIPTSTPVGDAPEMLERRGLITTFEPPEIAARWDEAYTNRARLIITPAYRKQISNARMIAEYARAITGVINQR